MNRRGFLTGLLAAPALIAASRLEFGVPKLILPPHDLDDAKLLDWYDFGSDFALSEGEKLTIDFGQSLSSRPVWIATEGGIWVAT